MKVKFCNKNCFVIELNVSNIFHRNECANKHYSTEFILNLLAEEGKGVFSARQNVLGHMQQGGVPSPFDRNLGIKMGLKALNFILSVLETSFNNGN